MIVLKHQIRQYVKQDDAGNADENFSNLYGTVSSNKTKYLRSTTGKKLMDMPLDLRSIEQKIFNVKYQAGGLIGKRKNDKNIKTT